MPNLLTFFLQILSVEDPGPKKQNERQEKKRKVRPTTLVLRAEPRSMEPKNERTLLHTDSKK